MFRVNKKIFSFANPLVIYSTVWLFVCFIYFIEFTNNIIGLNYKTKILIFSSILIFLLIYLTIFLFNLNRHKKTKQILTIEILNSYNRLTKFENIINKIFNFWIYLTILEIIYFKGIPLVSVVLLKQYDLNYKNFGIPSLHGLLNSCYYTVVIGQLLLYLFKKEKKYIFRIILLLFWPLLVMSRAVLLWVLVEIFSVILLFYNLSFKRFIKIFVSILLFIYIFGVIGDSRVANANDFVTTNFVNDKYYNIAEKIPTGFVWVYLYATTPINNIVTNINNLNPNYTFKYSLAGLIPTFINKLIFDESDSGPMILNNEAFNVSSFFANYLFDFGLFGSLIFVGILQLISVLIYFTAITGKFGSVIAYSTIFYALITSIFFDNFISLITIFQIILGFYINRLVYK